jgi:hypothetical protein
LTFRMISQKDHPVISPELGKLRRRNSVALNRIGFLGKGAQARGNFLRDGVKLRFLGDGRARPGFGADRENGRGSKRANVSVFHPDFPSICATPATLLVPVRGTGYTVTGTAFEGEINVKDLQDFPIPKSRGRTSRMGRPPLGVKPTQVRLSAELRARIEAMVGKHRMGQFLREAAEAELLRREAAGDTKPKPIKSTKPTKVRK